MSATRRSYDAVAERYAVEVSDELSGKPLDRSLLEVLRESCDSGLMADIGCGPGHVARFCAGLGLQVIALDLSPAMCSICQTTNHVPAAVADMTALPLRHASLDGVICWYSLIHLDDDDRAAAYLEIARVLRPGGRAVVAFHTSDADTDPGGVKVLTEWWDQSVDLSFRFLDPSKEVDAARRAGLRLVARTDREPYNGIEHPSRRSYLLLGK